MDKKLSFIIIIAVILLAVGGYFIFTGSSGSIVEDSSEIPLKTQDFKLFEIDTPNGSDFKIKNEADGMKFYKNSGDYSGNFSGIIINKGLTETLIGDNSFSLANSSSEQIYSSQIKNETIYKYVSNHDDVDVILMGNDLNLLKEASGSIKIKDTSSL